MGDALSLTARLRQPADVPSRVATYAGHALRHMSGLIVIGYDGSDEAGHAIDAAAALLRATEAVVVNIWTPGRGPGDDDAVGCSGDPVAA